MGKRLGLLSRRVLVINLNRSVLGYTIYSPGYWLESNRNVAGVGHTDQIGEQRVGCNLHGWHVNGWKVGAVGFVGNATAETAHFLGQARGKGTMPHGLIGYAGSTERAAEMYQQTFPNEDLTILVDYFGREITDTLAVCRRFPDLVENGRLSVRIDTPGGRYMEGLDPPSSYAVLERNAPDAIRGYRTEPELRHMIGGGVSAAAIWHLREQLDAAGYKKVRIVASSGFGPEKCKIMAASKAPIDVIGTGSFLPTNWHETYATADIIAYDGQPKVKVGREFLLRRS